MLELFMQPEAWVIFATLFALEVVLGVDNVVFISVLCERLPSHQRKARTKPRYWSCGVRAYWIGVFYHMDHATYTTTI